MSKIRVVLEIEVSDETIKRNREDMPSPEQYVQDELGWSFQSFDGTDILECSEIEEPSNG